ncbi:hypothetical protein AAGG74_14565 [Bacillus mexicanus]|uniref:hypothetical protein n=1 Tax=Bacillus mexicanus TaxID=2834415 RepID=UPI003D1BB48F
MKPVLLLSNSMFFHFTFCSLYKNEYSIESLLLRYLNRDINSQAEHFYTQFQENKRRVLYKNKVISDTNRLRITPRNIGKILEKCITKKYEKIIIELSEGNKDEIILLSKLSELDIPIIIFTSHISEDLYNIANKLEVESILQITDLFKHI